MGARFGPAAVRRASQMTSFNYAPWIERDFSNMKVFDAGKLSMNLVSYFFY